jgi:DUF3048 family protein
MRRILVAACVAAALLAACSSKGGHKKATSTTRGKSSTTQAVAADVAPLTGLPADAATRNRPALVVKVDNYAAKSYPQSGIGSADIVVCEGVEGGITRLMAIFQSKDAATVGPIRSARSTDLHLAEPLGKPLFAYSGTNGDFQTLIDRAPVIDLHPDKLPSAYHRDGSRPAPYNLFSSTHLFYEAPAAAGATAAKPLFHFGAQTAAADGTAVAKLDLHWKMPDRATSTSVEWTWPAGAPHRVQEGQATTDASGASIAPRNIVVLFVEYPDSGERDRSNSIVPEAKLQGVGEAWVIRDGKLTKGTWTKPGDSSPIELKDGSGKSIDLLPGQTWVELPAPGNATLG